MEFGHQCHQASLPVSGHGDLPPVTATILSHWGVATAPKWPPPFPSPLASSTLCQVEVRMLPRPKPFQVAHVFGMKPGRLRIGPAPLLPPCCAAALLVWGVVSAPTGAPLPTPAKPPRSRLRLVLGDSASPLPTSGARSDPGSRPALLFLGSSTPARCQALGCSGEQSDRSPCTATSSVEFGHSAVSKPQSTL